MKCGFVSLVGRPNVGKSTLLNSILGMKLAITSDVSGTTRNVIRGIYNDEDSQIIFVDTPGVHKPKNKLGNIMNRKAYNNTEGVDVILFLIDISKGFGKGDQFVLDKIKDKGVPVFLLLNKVDLVKNKEILLEEIDKLKDLYDFDEIIQKDITGTWYDPDHDIAIRLFEDKTAYLYFPIIDYYGDVAYKWEYVDRSSRGLCPALIIDTYGYEGNGVMFYIAGIRDDYFWCNEQGQIFYKQ